MILCLMIIIGCNQAEKTEQKVIIEEIKTPRIDFVKTIPITGVVSLAFAKIDTVVNLYQAPYIVVGKNEYPIKGYHSINGSREKILGLSPNSRYFIMDSISKSDEGERKACVVVDLLHKRVVRHLQNDCDGEWNAQGQWVKNGQVILSFD